MAHIQGAFLVGDDREAKDVLNVVGPARHVRGDIFRGHPRKNVPEREKPTRKHVRARRANIQKAQAARWAQR
jgi:hypothetical protein